MNRLLCLLLMVGALAFLPAATFAQEDDDATVLVTNDAELPADVEASEHPINEASDFDALTSLEYWHMLGFALPVLIGRIGNRLPKRWQKADHMAQLSIAAYLIYAFVGEFMKGSFDTMEWGTPVLVVASAIKVGGISYFAYKTGGNAFPKLVGGKPGPSA